MTHYFFCIMLRLWGLHQAGAPLLDNPATPAADVQFALLTYKGGHFNPRPHGLPRLAWELRQRTSIDIALQVVPVDAATEALFSYPLLVWQGDASFPPLPEPAIAALRDYLRRGGSLWVDVAEDTPGSGFEAAVRRDLQRLFMAGSGAAAAPLQRLSTTHVLYKTFYLLESHGGRLTNKPYLEGMQLDGRLAVMLSGNDLAGAMARDAFGAWEYDVGAGGEHRREMSFRLAINWVMYVLCLDYKADQVHLPFLLQRRH